MKRSLSSMWLVACVLLLLSCDPPPTPNTSSTADTYRPIYAPITDVRVVKALAPQALKKVGKIYLKGNYLFINDIGSGIHVIDNTDPTHPLPVSFLSIPGNQELAFKDSILYADNRLDLVTLNIKNPRDIKLVKRLENVFPSLDFPPFTNVRFECPDPKKGIIIGWEKAAFDNPQCFR